LIKKIYAQGGIIATMCVGALPVEKGRCSLCGTGRRYCIDIDNVEMRAGKFNDRIK
jgi:hypothetical protein